MGRFHQRARAARGVDARASARWAADYRAAGQRLLERLDRAADQLRGEPGVLRAVAPDWQRGRRSSRAVGGNAGARGRFRGRAHRRRWRDADDVELRCARLRREDHPPPRAAAGRADDPARVRRAVRARAAPLRGARRRPGRPLHRVCVVAVHRHGARAPRRDAADLTGRITIFRERRAQTTSNSLNPRGRRFALPSRMNLNHRRSLRFARSLLAVLCATMLAAGDTFALLRAAPQDVAPAAPETDAAPIPPEQLDSLVAPIALYPDPLLAQTLAASTYPLELLQLHQWLQKNTALKDQALLDAVSKQPWDPSIQAMAALPDVVKRLADDVQWATDLGNAFLPQQSDVMDAVQRMRRKAQDTGNLKSTQQQAVETRVVENKQVIVIEQPNPQVVYVPSYNPTIVYGPPVYPYPPIYYPPPGYYAAGMAVSFGVGVAMGAFASGGWGWNAGWGNNDIDINRNANFNRNVNVNGARNNTWQHNSQHRGGAPYGNRATANRYGGAARGESLANRQAGARQQLQSGGLRSGAVGTTGSLGSRSGTGSLSERAGTGNLGNRASTSGASQLGSRASGSGGDRIGSRDLSRSGSGSSSAFGGGGFNGSSARASSSRGSSSARSSRPSGGGGFSGGGGGGRSRGGGG